MKILIVFHTPSNAGYAMKSLEKTFFDVALKITGHQDDIYFAFKQYQGEQIKSLPLSFKNIFELDPERLLNKHYKEGIFKFLKKQQFDLALCFDLQVSGDLVSLLRKGNVKKIISYWGSTISSLNSGFKLFLKRVQVFFTIQKPDLFIFESEAMRYHAINGRGIPFKDTIVIPTGVDIKKFKPVKAKSRDLLNLINIPKESLVAIYTGHMEERKGVHVLILAMMALLDTYKNNKWHLIICGNRPGEENKFKEMLLNHPAKKNITFCGYRDDLADLMPQCDIGLIGSTGWDSFPMSALEMASCGLPLVVSNLQGLSETIEQQSTGILFQPGNSHELATILNDLSSQPKRLQEFSKNARKRVTSKYSLSIQKDKLELSFRSLT